MCKHLAFFFILIFSVGFSQTGSIDTTQKKMPLSKILKSLEKEYNVRFSFDTNLIEKYEFPSFKEEKNLEEKLKFLAKETDLLFERIDKKYIIIKVKEPTTNLTVCGFLIDEFSRLPILGATVLVEGKSIGTVTNQKGYFELKRLQSNWAIRVDYLGYQSKKAPVFKLVKGSCVTIALQENNEELEEVLISDYLTQGMVKKNDGSVQVSPRKLGILPGLTEPDVLQSLQLLPGVQSPNETASGIHVRGSTPDQNLILFDGVKMYQSGHFFGLISSFNPYVTQKISFYRSGTRAKYGDRIGGVLDISSGEDISKFKGGFGVNMTHGDAFIKTPLFNNKVGLVFSARRSLTDIWNSITYQKFSESVFQNTRILEGELDDRLSETENTFYFNDYNLKLIAQLSNTDKLIFSNLFNKNNLNYEAENERFHEEVSDNIEIENKGFDLKWKKKWSSKLNQEVEISNSGYELDYSGKRLVDRKNEVDDSEDIFTKYNEVKDFGVHYNLEYEITEKSTISGGYQYTRNKVAYLYENANNTPNNETLESGDAESNITNAFYLENIYKSGNWMLSTGLRVNHFSQVDELYREPRFFISNQISENFQLKFAAERKNQVVSQLIEFRNNGLGLENDIWALSDNENIPVLKSKQTSLGFLFQKNGWNLDVDFYKKTIDGLTLLTEDLVTRAPNYLPGQNKITGMDFLLKKRFGNYRSWISYTLSSSDFTYEKLNDGNSFSGTYDIPHSLVWSHTYSLNNFQFSLGWKTRSGTPYTKATGLEPAKNNPNKKVISYGAINGKRLSNTQKIDFSATYKFKFSKKGNTEGKLGLSLLNLFNTKNILDRTYETKIIRRQGNIEKEILVETDKVSIGFTPNMVFRVTF
jgi:outer membrane cobalamin receptor